MSTLLFLFLLHQGIAQEKKFERFLEEMNNYKADTCRQQRRDFVVNWSDYELKWTHIDATYGGSAYCCKGELTEGPLEPIRTPDVFSTESDTFQHFGEPLFFWHSSIECIGDQYIVEMFTASEPMPTSAQHYVYLRKYYRRKAVH